jgi:hypothetical protein
MAGSGVLALPRAVVDSGKWFCVCVFLFCVVIEDQELIHSHDKEQQKEPCNWDMSLTNQPWCALVMHGYHVSWHTCFTRQDLIRVN